MVRQNKPTLHCNAHNHIFMTAAAYITHFPDLLAVKYIHLFLSIKVNLYRFYDAPSLRVLGIICMKIGFKTGSFECVKLLKECRI